MKKPLLVSLFFLAPLLASAELLTYYSMEETSGTVRYDLAGDLDAAQGGEKGYFGRPSIPDGVYGDLTLTGTPLGSTGGALGKGSFHTKSQTVLGTLTNDFTVMSWVNPARVDGKFQWIISALTLGWGFGLTGDQILLSGFGIVNAVSVGGVIQANTWQHIAVTKSSTQGVTFFVNGIQIDRKPGLIKPWKPYTGAFRLLSGRGEAAYSGHFDEIKVFNTVLTQWEIKAAAVTPTVRRGMAKLAAAVTPTVRPDMAKLAAAVPPTVQPGMAKLKATKIRPLDFPANSQSGKKLREFQAKGYHYSEGPDPENGLDFALFEPELKPGEKAPLIMFLHGMGEHTPFRKLFSIPNVFEQVGNPDFQNKQPAYIYFPQHKRGERWYSGSWTKPSKALSKAVRALEELINTRAIDSSKLYVTGLSSGGRGTFEAAIKYPGLFAAAAPIACSYEVASFKANNLTPIWYSVNEKARKIHKTSPRKCQKRVHELGGDFRMAVFNDRGGHNAWDRTYSGDTGLWDWMFDQKLGATKPSWLSRVKISTSFTENMIKGESSKQVEGADGLFTTGFRIKHPIEANSHYTVTFKEPRKPQLFLVSASVPDQLAGKLLIESSTNGARFTIVKKLSNGINAFTTNRPIKALRIRAPRNIPDKGFTIRDLIKVSRASPEDQQKLKQLNAYGATSDFDIHRKGAITSLTFSSSALSPKAMKLMASIPTLRKLSLSKNAMVSLSHNPPKAAVLVPYFSRLSSLEELHIDTKNLHASSLEGLASSPNLTMLVLNVGNLTDKHLKVLTKSSSLTEVHLHNAKGVTGVGLVSLSKMPSLRELSMYGEDCPKLGRTSLQKVLKSKSLTHITFASGHRKIPLKEIQKLVPKITLSIPIE